MLSQSTKHFHVMVPKQTIDCFHESIGCFGFDNKSTIKSSFQPFLKTPKYKTIGCFQQIFLNTLCACFLPSVVIFIGPTKDR